MTHTESILDIERRLKDVAAARKLAESQGNTLGFDACEHEWRMLNDDGYGTNSGLGF